MEMVRVMWLIFASIAGGLKLLTERSVVAFH